MSNRYECTVCASVMYDERTWDQHIVGKKHQFNLNKVHAAQEKFRRQQATEQEEKPKQSLLCPVCNINVRDNDTYEAHLKGKKHIANAERIRKKVECGVYAAGIPLAVNPEALKQYFSTFGELEEFIHFPGKNYVLLQYKERQAARNVLQAPIFIFGRRLFIRPRRPPPALPPRREKMQPSATNDIDFNEVKALLTSGADVDALVRLLELPPNSDRKFKELCCDLETVLRPTFPQCSATPFGSTVTGLALKGSDLDVFLNVGDLVVGVGSGQNVTANEETSNPEKLVILGRKILRKCSNKFTNIIAVAKAKIPIIKFVHIPTNISCDVSFRNSRGVCNSQLIRFFISLDPRIRPYLMIIKYWARVHELAGMGRMSNYGLVMIALFYLQQLENPIIPSVAELQRPCNDSDLEDGWLCKFSTDKSLIRSTQNRNSLFELLGGFFLYFAGFDYGGYVICPLLGKAVPKSSFAVPDLLPEELHLFKQNPESVNFRYLSDMCIQDPFDLSHNLSGRMGGKPLSNWCAYCESASEIMKGILKNSEESKRIAALIQLFDVKINPQYRKFIMNSTRMVTYIRVAQYLSLGYFLDGGDDRADESDDANLRKVKVYKCFTLVYDLFMSILQKVMKFSVEEKSEGSSSKVQKVEEPSDVHVTPESGREVCVPIRTVYCEGSYSVWEGRKKVKKTLKIEQDADVVKVEEALSDVLMELKYSNGEIPPPILKFSCTFQLVLSPMQINLTFHNKGTQPRIFLSAMSFLQTRIPEWVDKNLSSLMKKHFGKSKTTRPPSKVNDPVAADLL